MTVHRQELGWLELGWSTSGAAQPSVPGVVRSGITLVLGTDGVAAPLGVMHAALANLAHDGATTPSGADRITQGSLTKNGVLSYEASDGITDG